MRFVLMAVSALLLAVTFFLVSVFVGLNYYGESCGGCQPWGLRALYWGAFALLVAVPVILLTGLFSAMSRRRES